MSVGGIGRGGSKGGAGKAGGAGGAAGARPTGGSTFGKVDKSESLVGASGLVGGSNVQSAEPVLSAQAAAISKQLKAGTIGKGDATKKLVAEVLKEKLRLSSKTLTDKVADALQDDPRLSQTLERIWSKG